MSQAVSMPIVTAIEMGYGHLRAAEAVAEALGTEVLAMDQAPLGSPFDERSWARARQFHEGVSRLSQRMIVGRPLRWILEEVTAIAPLHPLRDMSRPSLGALALERFSRHGLGRALKDKVTADGATLVSTFFAASVLAERHGWTRNLCIVTDTDINRAWAPVDSAHTRIRYCVPSQRAMRRLRAYGVPAGCIRFTGFPLPPALLGGPELPVLKQNLAARLVRLDPSGVFRARRRHEVEPLLGPLPEPAAHPPLLVFAVGGAGAQAELAQRFLPGLVRPILSGALRLALVAGTRKNVADTFRRYLASCGLASEIDRRVTILVEDGFKPYYARVNALLAEADILWTKPSEMSFYAALGLPEIISAPVGVHEDYNRRWLLEHGAGLVQGDPRYAGEWILDWLHDGVLAEAAWSGFVTLPKDGTYRIAALAREWDAEAGE